MENNDLLKPQLEVDNIAAEQLSDMAKWAKFLAIMGFIFCGLFVLLGLFFGTIMSKFSTLGSSYSGGMMGGVMGTVYVFLALLYFFPCLFLYRFATKMKIALQSDDQQTLNEAFSNHRRMYKFMGILMIVLLAFYALAFVGLFIANMFRG